VFKVTFQTITIKEIDMRIGSLLILTSLSWNLAADPLKSFNFEVPQGTDQSSAQSSECTFQDLSIPDNAVVYAVGTTFAHNTKAHTSQSAESAATHIDVAVNSPSKPVLLILEAYTATDWNIGWSEKTKILAVLASGYHQQAVTGLTSDVKVLTSSSETGGPCDYFFVEKEEPSSLNPKSQALFGKPVEHVFLGDGSGKIVVGEPLYPGVKLVTSGTTNQDSTESQDNSAHNLTDQSMDQTKNQDATGDSETSPSADEMPQDSGLPSREALNQAVAKGLIRRATEADIDRWFKGLEQHRPDLNFDFADEEGVPRTQSFEFFNPYVVLKQYTYPAGLHGANAATFFIEKGVPQPSGNPGHSNIYDFNDYSCQGISCTQ
jgi:hypothetical protein